MDELGWLRVGLIMLLMMIYSTLAGAGEGTRRTSSELSLTDTSWTLAALAGQAISPGPAVTLRFAADGTLGGFDGCNRYQGAFSAAASTLHIPSEIVTTRRACPEPLASQARAYAEALSLAAFFVIDGSRLNLRDEDGGEVVVFEASSMTLTGPVWEVVAYNNGQQAYTR